MTDDELRLLNKKFQFMRFLDYARWNGENNYNNPNMADKSVPGEEVLLTHFLGYITNRQTPFETIFDRLDYIFSQIVHDFEEGASVEKLLSLEQADIKNDSNTSYFVKKQINDKRKNNRQDKEGIKDKDIYTFVSHRQTYKGIEYRSKDSQYPAITEVLCKEHDGVFFASSRFYTTDYMAIRSVLDILDEMFDKSFSSFMNRFIGHDKNREKNNLERLLYALWILGYKDVGQWDIEEVKCCIATHESNKYKEMLEKKKAALVDLEKNGLNSSAYRNDFSRDSKKSNRYKAKRVICYLRDLLKCQPYVERFKEIIDDSLFAILYSQIPDCLELPGDTWNNNIPFQECLGFANSNYQKTDTPNVRIRNIYKELCKSLNEVGCYPEQFDCSFDFVPRMCNVGAKSNCRYCPISTDNMESDHLHIPKEFCHKDKDKYCPFLLYAAGYKIKCGDMKEDICPNKKKQ